MRYYIAFNPDSMAYDLRDSKRNSTLASSHSLEIVRAKLDNLNGASESELPKMEQSERAKVLFFELRNRIGMLKTLTIESELTNYTIESIKLLVDKLENEFRSTNGNS